MVMIPDIEISKEIEDFWKSERFKEIIDEFETKYPEIMAKNRAYIQSRLTLCFIEGTKSIFRNH